MFSSIGFIWIKVTVMSPWSEYRSVVLQYFVMCRPPPGCRLFSNFCFRTSAKCWRYFSEEQQSFVTPTNISFISATSFWIRSRRLFVFLSLMWIRSDAFLKKKENRVLMLVCWKQRCGRSLSHLWSASNSLSDVQSFSEMEESRIESSSWFLNPVSGVKSWLDRSLIMSPTTICT